MSYRQRLLSIMAVFLGALFACNQVQPTPGPTPTPSDVHVTVSAQDYLEGVRVQAANGFVKCDKAWPTVCGMSLVGCDNKHEYRCVHNLDTLAKDAPDPQPAPAPAPQAPPKPAPAPPPPAPVAPPVPAAPVPVQK